MLQRLNPVPAAPTRVEQPSAALDLLADLVAQSHRGTRYERSWYAGRWNLAVSMTSDRGFHVVLDGRADVRLPDGEVIGLGPGDLIVLSVPHELGSDLGVSPVPFDPQTVGRVQTTPEAGDACLLCGAYQLADPERHPVFSNLPPAIVLRAGRRDPSVDAMIQVLDAELRRPAAGSRAVAERLVDALLIYALRHLLEIACPETQGWLRALRDPVLARALALIHRDYASAWTLESLARASGTSRASLARHFAAQVGSPPMTYLTARRLEVARRMMQTSSASLAEIADAVGYASPFSLSKAFKRHFGESPSHFVARV